MFDFIIGHADAIIYITLIMIGFYTMITNNNLLKKIVGMNIFQWSIILFFVSLATKSGATIPIVENYHHGQEVILKASDYINPLPHVLMLTAIVVGVATTGVGLALILRIYKIYGTIEEDEILKKLQ